MPTNPMTEKQAWLTIAEAYATPRENRSEKRRHLAAVGVCSALTILWVRLEIGYETYHTMRSKVIADANNLSGCPDYFCACYPANDKLRALYCLLNYYMLGGTKC